MLVNLGIHTLFTLILAYYYYNTFRLIPHFIQVYYISSLYYISTVQCSLTLFITTYLSQQLCYITNSIQISLEKQIRTVIPLFSSIHFTFPCHSCPKSQILLLLSRCFYSFPVG